MLLIYRQYQSWYNCCCNRYIKCHECCLIICSVCVFGKCYKNKAHKYAEGIKKSIELETLDKTLQEQDKQKQLQTNKNEPKINNQNTQDLYK